MKPAVRSLLTSSSMTFSLSGAKCLFFYLTDLIFGSIFSRWVITSGGMPDISVTDQAKISKFALSRFISCWALDQTVVIQFEPFSQDLLFLMEWRLVVQLVHPFFHSLFGPIYQWIKNLQIDYFMWTSEAALGKLLITMHFSDSVSYRESD